MKTLFTGILAIFVFVAMGQKNMTFSDWDQDEDGLIERQEFTAEFVENYFSAWDMSNTQGLIEEDFFKNSFAGLDTDGDAYLSDEEWLIGINYFYDDYLVYEDVDAIDINDDGRISYDEYYDVVYETNYFTDIDLDNDNYISEYELANYVFENWDTNDTGTLSRSEYNQFDWYYLDV